MPRYFFNLSDGVCNPDDAGLELSDLLEVRCEALRLATRALEEHPADSPFAVAHVNVRDETNAVRMIVRVTCSTEDSEPRSSRIGRERVARTK